MVDISGFVRRVNTNPSCLVEVNWWKQTEGFYGEHIRKIILGIEDDKVCNLVTDYILDSLYAQEDTDCGDVEYVLHKSLKEREMMAQRKKFKQALDEKARSLGNMYSAYADADRANEPFVCDNLFSNHYYQEYHRLQKENEQLRKELELYKNNTQGALYQARIDGIRSVVEQLIIYGENFPSNQNDKAEVIKEALLAKSFNGHIPSEALTPEWKARLNNLGRKEMGVSFQGESMFKVTGNKEVNIGGK